MTVLLAHGKPVRAAFLFDMFGPYHLARLNAAAEHASVLGVEVRARSLTYPWEPSDEPTKFERVTLLGSATAELPSFPELVARLLQLLSRFGANVVFVPGWASRAALAAITAAKALHLPVVVMSESTPWDSPRQTIREWLKRQIVSQFSAALVGGRSHRRYLEDLGMQAGLIRSGYDVVDNNFFRAGAQLARSVGRPDGLPTRYILASARFIPIKNLPLLIDAYAGFRQAHPDIALHLILLGDGEERPGVEAAISRHQLQGHVHLPGFKQYGDLPTYYAHADFFVHVSTIEPWGLVVNEAMAAGLPVIVSTTCGCAADLVTPEGNGLLVHPTDQEQLTQAIARLALATDERARFGKASEDIIGRYGPAAFGQGAIEAARVALAGTSKGSRPLPRLLTAAMGRVLK